MLKILTHDKASDSDDVAPQTSHAIPLSAWLHQVVEYPVFLLLHLLDYH